MLQSITVEPGAPSLAVLIIILPMTWPQPSHLILLRGPRAPTNRRSIPLEEANRPRPLLSRQKNPPELWPVSGLAKLRENASLGVLPQNQIPPGCIVSFRSKAKPFLAEANQLCCLLFFYIYPFPSKPHGLGRSRTRVSSSNFAAVVGSNGGKLVCAL